MKEKYIILKSISKAETRDPFRGATVRGIEPVLKDFQIEVEEIPSNKITDVTRNTDVVAMAPEMPMKLLKPVANVPPEITPDTQGMQMAWGIKAVGADTSPYTGDGVVVAVLDTGIDASHPTFKGVKLIQQDFTGEGNGDALGHGTHCAGTIFGRDVNGFRIGIARGVKKALIGKVIGTQGGSSIEISKAIRWALDQGANVISMSLGIDYPGYVNLLKKKGLPDDIAVSQGLVGYRTNIRLFESLARFIQASEPFSQAAVLVAAAGNESQRNINPDWVVDVSPPAVSEGFISVAALDQTLRNAYSSNQDANTVAALNQTLRIADFSNQGANISGPGVGIPSAKVGGELVAMSGTSMAAPHVAGVAALWSEKLIKSGRLNSTQLTAKLLGTATTLVLSAYNPYDVGVGLVQAPK